MRRRRRHVRRRYARRCRPAGVWDQIMPERNASEPGRPRLAANRVSDPGPRREVEETKLSGSRRGVGRAHSTGEALEPAGDERRRRAWREGARSEGRRTTTHAPDPAPDQACHRRRAPADRNYMGRQALNADRARPSITARREKAARRDLCGGRREIAVPTAPRLETMAVGDRPLADRRAETRRSVPLTQRARTPTQAKGINLAPSDPSTGKISGVNPVFPP
jgi:hypothetical protein